MIGNILAALGLVQSGQHRQDDLDIKTHELLAEVQANILQARGNLKEATKKVTWECGRVGVPVEAALQPFVMMDRALDQAEEQANIFADNLNKHGAKREALIGLSS